MVSKEKNRTFMNRFDHIALREKSACDLVYKLTGKNVQVVLDPTLLFTGEQWMHIQHEEPLTNGKYIFAIYLETIQNNVYSSRVYKKTNLKIVAFQQLDEYIPSDEGFADEAPYNVGPAEFLNYIRNAEYVFTDSFHCSVFSILYKRIFTFSRFSENAKQSTNTRIDNLLNLTGLPQRRISVSSSIEDILTMPLDYTGVDERLNILRASSLDYLQNALKDIAV